MTTAPPFARRKPISRKHLETIRELARAASDDSHLAGESDALEITPPFARQAMASALHETLDEIVRLRDLLRRVRCYAVVNPLGNAARMLGIESDIDAALEGT